MNSDYDARPGQGTFVTRMIDPFVTVLTADPKTGFGGGETAAYLSKVREEHREPASSVPRVEVVPADAPVASLLDVPAGTQVISRTQDRYIDGIPWSRQTSFYLMDFITKGATKLLMAMDIEEGSHRRRLVPAGRLKPAYALNSVSCNLGRAVAPLVVLAMSVTGIGNAAKRTDDNIAWDRHNWDSGPRPD